MQLPYLNQQHFDCTGPSLQNIPDDSPDWVFAMTGLFIMFGVPMMAVAMAQTARSFVSVADVDEAKSKIEEVVTRDELVVLQDLGLEDCDGEIDKAEVSTSKQSDPEPCPMFDRC